VPAYTALLHDASKTVLLRVCFKPVFFVGVGRNVVVLSSRFMVGDARTLYNKDEAPSTKDIECCWGLQRARCG